MGKLRAFFYNLDSERKYKNVIEQISSDNRRFCINWSIVLLLYWTMSIIMSFFDEYYRMCRSVYIVSFVLCTISLFLALFGDKKSIVLTNIISIILRATLLGSGVGIAVFQNNRTIVIFVAAILSPLMFVSDVQMNLLLDTLTFMVFSVFGYFTMSQEFYTWTWSNFIIFSTAGLLVGYFINKTRFDSYIYAEGAKKLVEVQTKFAYYDQMTNLKNRRAYSEKIESIQDEENREVGIIMLDVNGLKHTNDTLGHSAGDELIKGASECLVKGFENTDMIYRLGGDEFCVIIDGSIEDVEKAIENFNIVIKNWTGNLIKKVSISYGWAYSKDFDNMDKCIKSADDKMYAAKRLYYQDSRNDRRASR